MASISQNLTIDLTANRIVRENNTSVGQRTFSFSEGSIYQGTIALVKAGETVSSDLISEFTLEIGNDTNDVALVRQDGTDENVSLSFNGDLIRQYLYNSKTKFGIFNLSLTVDGVGYILNPVSCVLVANPDDNTGEVEISWDDVTDKPSTFDPSIHTHAISDVTNLQATLDGKATTSHTHTASNISDSTSAGRSLLTAANVAAQRALLNPAKLVEVADSTERLALTSGQVNVGDIVREVGVPATLGTVIVTGAGTAATNGTYTEGGTNNGKPVYTSPNGYYFSFEFGSWMLFDETFTTLYFDSNYASTDSPAGEDTIWDFGDGDAPAPTITQGITPIPAVPAGGTYAVVDTAELNNAAGWQEMSGQKSVILLSSNNSTGQSFTTGSLQDIIFAGVTSSRGDLFSYDDSTGEITVTRDCFVNVTIGIGPNGGWPTSVTRVTLLVEINGSVVAVGYEFQVDATFRRPYPTSSSIMLSLAAGDKLTASFISLGATTSSENFNSLNFMAVSEL